MQQKTPKAQIGYVLLGFSTVLFLAIFYLIYLNMTGDRTSIAVPLGLVPIALLNAILAGTMIAKPKT